MIIINMNLFKWSVKKIFFFNVFFFIRIYLVLLVIIVKIFIFILVVISGFLIKKNV